MGPTDVVKRTGGWSPANQDLCGITYGSSILKVARRNLSWDYGNARRYYIEHN